MFDHFVGIALKELSFKNSKPTSQQLETFADNKSLKKETDILPPLRRGKKVEIIQ